jgi:hypothetical protein
MGDRIIGHISRDSTLIDAREKPVKKIKILKPKKKRGRPKKGEVRIKELTRLEPINGAQRDARRAAQGM